MVHEAVKNTEKKNICNFIRKEEKLRITQTLKFLDSLLKKVTDTRSFNIENEVEKKAKVSIWRFALNCHFLVKISL